MNSYVIFVISIIINFVFLTTGSGIYSDPCLKKLQECVIEKINTKQWTDDWDACCNNLYSRIDSFNKSTFLMEVNKCAQEKSKKDFEICEKFCDESLIKAIKENKTLSDDEQKFVEHSAPEKPSDVSHCEDYVHKVMKNVKENCKPESEHYREECESFELLHEKYSKERKNHAPSISAFNVVHFIMEIILSLGILMTL
ncbi:uncharacterized protein LOC111623312 isoform X2 [Centruroides sculpturatus]|uniref:uncharacterized protein LOC111623312 isoform X1 n=1 Tax=Centruroides sculpturatus TaxID=218467 RepID=UPI000C6DDDAE|nr:uncharacterized protein LOC111623312 isoform X1 [Centruroides sculpturatus]XP_023221610.1 uncharacterized protein LOC111623312 isoform X2 [Centruroides sculpturatus]